MRALVLSGGGCKGAYQVGALSYLLGQLGRRYSILCGVSVGALNAAFLAQFASGEEKQASAQLEALWAPLDTPSIYRKWPVFGEAAAIWKSSVYDSTPLQRLVRTKLDAGKVRNSGKKLRVGAVSLNSGEYRVFAEDHPNLVEGVIASSAFPVMFAPVLIEGQLWTDGGVREVTPIQAAIDLGADTIDAIVCSPADSKAKFPAIPIALRVAERSIDLMSDEIIENDLKVAELYNQLAANKLSTKRVIKLWTLRPSSSLIDNSLDFSPAKAKEMKARGFQDAKDHVVAT